MIDIRWFPFKRSIQIDSLAARDGRSLFFYATFYFFAIILEMNVFNQKY